MDEDKVMEEASLWTRSATSFDRKSDGMTVETVDAHSTGRVIGDWRYRFKGICCDLWMKRVLKVMLI